MIARVFPFQDSFYQTSWPKRASQVTDEADVLRSIAAKREPHAYEAFRFLLMEQPVARRNGTRLNMIQGGDQCRPRIGWIVGTEINFGIAITVRNEAESAVGYRIGSLVVGRREKRPQVQHIGSRIEIGDLPGVPRQILEREGIGAAIFGHHSRIVASIEGGIRRIGGQYLISGVVGGQGFVGSSRRA
jgi:hypothetical protein